MDFVVYANLLCYTTLVRQRQQCGCDGFLIVNNVVIFKKI